MFKFSPYTIEILYQNGWTESRQINTAPYTIYFEETQQPKSEAIINFLGSFGGLELKYPNKKALNIMSSCDFDPIEGHKIISTESLNDYARHWILKPFCVIGLLVHDVMIMTQLGEVYSLFDHYVYKLGNTGEEMIENICHFKGIERIYRQA